MNISVRKARETELKIIQDLNYKLFLWNIDRDPGLNVKWPYEEAGENYFRKRISGEQGVCFVAEDNGTVVGHVAGKVNKEVDKTETILRCELENIFVESTARSKGAGRLLVKELIEWCQEKGAESMLVTAYSGNEGAVAFYEACGFRPFAITLEQK